MIIYKKIVFSEPGHNLMITKNNFMETLVTEKVSIVLRRNAKLRNRNTRQNFNASA